MTRLFDHMGSQIITDMDPTTIGLPDTPAGWGLVACTEGTGRRYTIAVEGDYAANLLAAQAALTGVLNVPEQSVRWVRLGHPDEWGTATQATPWAPVYPMGTVPPEPTEDEHDDRS
ncbi:hypothetical protein [Paenarthrobacter sp. JL.01a]|uniref:hypothetical protein n=1 Tax=Paenarthrobacter sp. JL.01a TaxID=2979324 RepID=UPI0021C6B3B1|nr:hypothetical protein [Paenarthrobacter sp. JL.01a]UXM93311.1 hypothetical protein N5P29_08395 [Paenarthrobacter sp. JL.01a]